MVSESEYVSSWEEFFNKIFISQNGIEFTYFNRIMPFFDGDFPNTFYIYYHDIDLFHGDFGDEIRDDPVKPMNACRRVIIESLYEEDRDKASRKIWEPRIIKMPHGEVVKIAEINASHMGLLISVPGIVHRISTPKLLLKAAMMKCGRCDASHLHLWLDPLTWENSEPMECPKDQGGCGRSIASTKFSIADPKSVTQTDFQKITIEELPETIEHDRQPRKITCILQKDMVDVITPGDRVVIHGIPTAFKRKDKTTGAITFEKIIDLHSVDIEEKIYEDIEFTDHDINVIEDMPNDPDFMANLVKSISPTIKGRLREKEAMMYQQAGGVVKHMADGTRIRGDLHLLMIGDPGCGKTQLLRYQFKISPRGVFTSGKTTTAAGLCVAPGTKIIINGKETVIDDLIKSIPNEEYYEYQGLLRARLKKTNVRTYFEGRVIDSTVQYIWKIPSSKKLVKIELEDGKELTLTPNTPVLTENRGWIASKDLNTDDTVLAVED